MGRRPRAAARREKEHTRLGDEIARERRELPWVLVEKDYRFDTDDGEKALGELFDGRSQLLVYHFMFGPSYQAGCPVNSSIADSIDGVLPHLRARDVTFSSRLTGSAREAPGIQAADGLELPWASASRTDFNFDLGFSHTEEQAREAGLGRRLTGRGPGYRRSSSATPARAARTSLDTSPRAPGSARSSGTVTTSTTRTRRRGADWSFSWATTRSSTMHQRAATRARRGSSGSAGTTSTDVRPRWRPVPRPSATLCCLRPVRSHASAHRA